MHKLRAYLICNAQFIERFVGLKSAFKENRCRIIYPVPADTVTWFFWKLFNNFCNTRNETQLDSLIEELVSLPAETEWVVFEMFLTANRKKIKSKIFYKR